jgi:excisionase family DNA binding protein
MWLTLSEVAKYLRVSKETVYKLAQQSRIPASKLGNQWRFKQELVDQWLEAQTNEAVGSTENVNKGAV